MSEHNDFHADPNHDDLFEREMRGYSRRRVDEFVAKTRSQIRDLEDRLSQALDSNERLRLELSSAREAAAEKPAHEEISERIGQILKLAEDESKSQRTRADEEIATLREQAQAETAKLRENAKAETDKTRAEAHEQAERMLSAAQEQAESTVADATAEADKARKSARAESERAVTEATKQAESAVVTAKAQAKQQLDEATARATAIHDGAERRLNLLMSRHTEAIRRLTEIRDVVTTLVAGEAGRGSLEEEVSRAVAAAQADGNGSQEAASRPAPRVGQAGGMTAPVPATQGAVAQTHGAGAGAGAQAHGAQAPAAPVPGAPVPGAPVRAGQAAAAQPVRGGQAGGQPASASRPSQPAGVPAAPVQSAAASKPAEGNGGRTPTAAARPGGGQPEAARHAAAGDETSDNLRAIRE